ncbi:hypothetical protein D3C85_1602610 [compost metagenome]
MYLLRILDGRLEFLDGVRQFLGHDHPALAHMLADDAKQRDGKILHHDQVLRRVGFEGDQHDVSFHE